MNQQEKLMGISETFQVMLLSDQINEVSILEKVGGQGKEVTSASITA